MDEQRVVIFPSIINFHFPKIAFPENIYFPKNILHEPNTASVVNFFTIGLPDNASLLWFDAKI